ncbi:MAG: nicotinate-nucleotide diphosphorylase (carboxylating), partial [Acidobacteriota bacterium]
MRSTTCHRLEPVLLPPLPEILWRPLVDDALREDLGRAGDVTSDAIIPVDARARGLLRARSDGRVAGLDVALGVFRCLDPTVETTVHVGDGADAEPGAVLAAVDGLARPMLGAERTALNLLGHLSGIATVTREIVHRIEGTDARVVCTRKTTPLLRALEKRAVRLGGGASHRFGLDDAVLIKDNHRAVAGGGGPPGPPARPPPGAPGEIGIDG